MIHSLYSLVTSLPSTTATWFQGNNQQRTDHVINRLITECGTQLGVCVHARGSHSCPASRTGGVGIARSCPPFPAVRYQNRSRIIPNLTSLSQKTRAAMSHPEPKGADSASPLYWTHHLSASHSWVAWGTPARRACRVTKDLSIRDSRK